ncbi:MAG: hypothetical protein ACREQY_04880, partial [Candidatus Binatia bacterium]
EYHRWYDETHLPEVVGVEGFVSARRFAPIGDGGRFIAIYELEADDLEAVRTRLNEAISSGKFSSLELVQDDPPPVVRWFEQITDYKP